MATKSVSASRLFGTTRNQLFTSGTGLWTKHAGPVTLKSLELVSHDGFETAELRVHVTGWSRRELGPIYTDPGFLEGLQKKLRSAKLPGGVGYTEHGMQGPSYVSLDTGKRTLRALVARMA